MKWFFKWLREGIKNAERNEEQENMDIAVSAERQYRASPGLAINVPKVKAGKYQTAVRDDSIHLNSQAMHFRIYPATGGHIVEYQYYDEKLDRNHQALHLIPSELDMGSELSKIMTLEALKR